MGVATDLPGLASHYAVSAWRAQVYQAGVRDGEYVPFVLPFIGFGGVLLFLHLLLPVRQRFVARLATFSLDAAFYVWIILHCKAYSPFVSFAAGLLSAWSILWAANLLIFNDAKRDFKRLKPCSSNDPSSVDQASQRNGTLVAENGNGRTNGHAKDHANGSTGDVKDPAASLAASAPPSSHQWQSFPNDSFCERLSWASDLLTTFRGIGWNWRIVGLPSRPAAVEASLLQIPLTQAIEADKPFSRSGRKRLSTRSQVIRRNLYLLFLSYMVLDATKTAMNHDPYFWKGLSDQPPPTYLPLAIRSSTVLTRVYRLSVALCFLWGTLQVVFAAMALLLGGLLGPEVIGSAGEAWMYVDQYGGIQSVMDRGLAGFWGEFWHQIFRYGFQAAGKWVASDVLRLRPESPISAIIQLCASFDLSGVLHAAGSITMTGTTYPWSGQFLFFALQPLGIILGMTWVQILKSLGVRRSIPLVVGWAANLAYVGVWIYLTFPLLADDLARGGLMLYEPVAISPLRGLGLGVPGDGWFCWNTVKVAWHSDRYWWRSGITL